MVEDEEEKKIIQIAAQPGLRDFNRPRTPFKYIIQDFLHSISANTTCLDLGPGHYDLSVLLRERSIKTVCLDNDDAVVRLGKYKGFKIFKHDLKKIPFPINNLLDGIFCKFSINASWFNKEETESYINYLTKLIKNDGWSWIAPWNGISSRESYDLSKERAEFQSYFFKKNGFEEHKLSKVEAMRYGITGNTVNNVIFTKGL